MPPELEPELEPELPVSFSHSAWEVGSLNPASQAITERQFSGGFREEGNESWIFDLASLTKLLVTAPLVIGRFYRHPSQFAKLTLGEVLSETSPLADNLKSLTLPSLLSHTSGLAPWVNFYVNHLTDSADLARQRHRHVETVLSRLPDAKHFAADPSKPSTYSDIGYILLGYALEQDSGVSMSALWRRWLTEFGLPEGAELGYCDSIAKQHAITTGFCPVRQRQLTGEVHDENAASLGGLAGHAGLFGSLPALSVLLPRWYQDHRVQTLIELTADSQDGVGFRRGDDQASKEFGGGKAIGHYGFTGTSLWLIPPGNDTKGGAYHLLLTNRVMAGRLALSTIKKYRQMIYRYGSSLVL